MRRVISKIARTVLPSSAIDLLRRRPRGGQIYKSWDEATRAAKSSYSGSDLTSFRTARSTASLGKEETIVAPNPELDDLLRGGSGTFVDFGGSFGELCSVLKRRHPGWDFTVIEFKEMADAASKLGRDVTFTDQLPEVIDVFHSSSTLQYLEDPIGLWKLALARTTRHAYLARNCFSNEAQFLVQASSLFDNGAGPIPPGFKNVIIQYPHRTLVEKEIVTAAEEAGFSLVLRVEGRNSGVTADARNAYGADLLFERRK